MSASLPVVNAIAYMRVKQVPASMPSPSNSENPVSVLTGYLGAGKTVAQPHLSGPRQEIRRHRQQFGEIGIDNELVVSADEEVFEMNNGCICTVRGPLVRIIDGLMRRKGNSMRSSWRRPGSRIRHRSRRHSSWTRRSVRGPNWMRL
jgi:hypothetical protein